MPRVRVARLDELAAGRPRLVEVEGRRVVLVRVHDEVYACDDACAHRGGPLSEGRVTGTRLACPWHGWQYDVRTGECLLPRRGARVAIHAVAVEAGEVWIEVEDGHGADAVTRVETKG